jgi:hypothetical protein
LSSPAIATVLMQHCTDSQSRLHASNAKVTRKPPAGNPTGKSVVPKTPRRRSRFRSFVVQQGIMRDRYPTTPSVTPSSTAASTHSSLALSSTLIAPSTALIDHQSNIKLTSSNDQKQARTIMRERSKQFYLDFGKHKMQCLSWSTTCAPGDLNTRDILSLYQLLCHLEKYTESNQMIQTMLTLHDYKFRISQEYYASRPIKIF